MMRPLALAFALGLALALAAAGASAELAQEAEYYSESGITHIATSVCMSGDGLYAAFTSHQNEVTFLKRSGVGWALLHKVSQTVLGNEWCEVNEDGTVVYVSQHQANGNSGQIHAYGRAEGTDVFAHEGVVTPPAALLGGVSYFGQGFAIDATGTRLAVGARGYPNAAYLGSVIFMRRTSASTWEVEEQFYDGAGHLGYSAAMNAAGDRAFVGALTEDAGEPGGAVRVYERTGADWAHVETLHGDETAESGDNFGYRVSCTADGNTVLVTALRADSGGVNSAGAAYVFDNAGGTTTFAIRKRVSGPAETNSSFGRSGRISLDGNVILIGAYQENGAATSQAGAMYEFRQSTPGDSTTWALVKRHPFTSSGNGQLGYALDLSPSGAYAIVSAVGASRLYFFTAPTCTADLPSWPATASGTSAESLDGCPAEAPLGGPYTRDCLDGSVWAEPDASLCTDCAAEAPAVPLVSVADSEVSAEGALNLVLRTSAVKYASAPQLRFVGATAPAECSSSGAGVGAGGEADDDGVWLHERDGVCADKHTLTRPLPRTLAACGFAGPEEDADRDTYYYEATLEVETEEAAGTVLGQDVTRTEQTAVRVRVEFPRDAQVEAGGEAYGPAIDLAAVSTQLANAATREFVFQLATSVQWPYYLVESGSVAPTASGGAFEDATPAVTASSGGTCNGAGEGEDEACTQLFEIKAKTGAAECSLDTRVRVDFEIRCRVAFAGACDAPAPGTTHAEFDVVTGAQLCAQVVEVAQVTPTLVTSTSQGGPQATDFVLQTTLHGRVSVVAEGGVTTQAVALSALEIASDCTGCGDATREPMSDSSPAASSYSWQTTPGVTYADFQFQLNTNSAVFDAGAGQASLTLTATVAVTYVAASGQRVTETRRVQMQAGGAGETVSARATATIGARAVPSSSSTAGSTVLGVSTGTAMMAGVGLVAVVALAAGAAVAARRRSRRGSATRATLKESSSTASLELEAAPAALSLPVDNLRVVQTSYASV